ncbi:AraC family transcriptional regulator [uncultured Muribaculum sp.]|uniref:helix-turn-helix domain-containing protein n=1 Tax=uncultured Muribaculum sp. TaxID=1918613 RepID=UPI0025FA510D|nr:response regulator transcription factor [uncultured Muribaculum sp.]
MEIYQADTIEKYNRYFGFETRHPLVGIVHFDSSVPQNSHTMAFGFYALFLKKTTGCRINYGKTNYDFDDETVVSFAPGQTVGIYRLEDGPVPESVGLLFHPDFLHRTPLGKKIKQYSFFSYASNEALHLSTEERMILQDYMDKIARELQHPIDRFSKSLIISNIEVMLNYCMRFYERQFVTREELNHSTLGKFEQLLDDYIDNGLGATEGIPTVKYFADKICLSPNYFGDLVKSETGKTAQEYIQLKMLNFAKSSLSEPQLNTKQIAELLGFQYPQHFIRFFKKQTGITPREYRLHLN